MIFDKALIKSKLEEILKDSEIFIVEIKIQSNIQKALIRLDKNPTISIDECAVIHRKLYDLLETEIENFELEISSPGIDAPFKVFQQYIKNIGRKVEVYTNESQSITGDLIEAIENEYIIIELKNKEKLKINFSQINKTKLIISFK